MKPDLITLTVTEAELRAIAGLFDAAVRHGGLASAKDAVFLAGKFETQANEQYRAAEAGVQAGTSVEPGNPPQP